MRLIVTAAVLAGSVVLPACRDIPTGAEPRDVPLTVAASEGAPGVEVLPLDLVAPAEPDPWRPYEYTFEPIDRYRALGVTFVGGQIEPVRDEEGRYTRYHWYPNADPSSVWPFYGTQWNELRFAPALGARVVRVELDLQYVGWSLLDADYLKTPRPLLFTCHAADGAVLGSDALDGDAGSAFFDAVRTVAVSGAGFARCRTSHEPRTRSRIVGMRLTLLPVQAAKVALRCEGDLGPGRVTRGRPLRCEAAKDPEDAPGDLVVTGWSFDGAPRVDGDPASHVWEGVMVRGGSVEVRGRIGGGAEQTARAGVEVERRPWRDLLPPLQVDTVACSPPLTDRCPLGSPLVYEKDVGVTRVFLGPGQGIPIGHVTSGPNTGWSYVAGEDPPLQLDGLVIFLNRELFDPASDFYRRSDCDPARLPEIVWRHELAHARHAERLAASGHINLHFEDLVRFGPKEAFERVLAARVRRDLRSRLLEVVDADHSTVGFLEPGCELRLRPNRGEADA